MKMEVKSGVKKKVLLIIIFIFGFPGQVSRNYCEEKRGSEIDPTVGRVVKIDTDLRMIAIKNFQGEEERFPIEKNTKIWGQIQLEDIKLNSEVIIDYKTNQDGMRIPVQIYVNEKNAGEEKVEPEAPEEIDMKPEDKKEEEFKNKDFFEGVDSTKLNYDMELGVTEDEKK